MPKQNKFKFTEELGKAAADETETPAKKKSAPKSDAIITLKKFSVMIRDDQNEAIDRIQSELKRQHIDLKKALLTRLALDDFLATYEADPAGTLRRLYELEQNEIERGDEWRRNGRSVGLEEKFGG